MSVLRRWVPALGVVGLTAVFATGCGIRPTAVPVDAGAPAVRTACPSPLHPPAVAAPSSAAALPKYQPQPTRTAPNVLSTPGPPVPGSPRPSAPSAAAAASSTPPTGSLFSAIPSPAPSGTGSLHCG